MNVRRSPSASSGRDAIIARAADSASANCCCSSSRLIVARRQASFVGCSADARFNMASASARRHGLLAGPSARGESKVGSLEKAGRILERIRQRWTAQTVAVALKAHVAAGFDVFIFFVIDQRVGPDRQVSSAQDGVALRLGVLSCDALDAICVHDSWQGGTLVTVPGGTPQLEPLPLRVHRGRTEQRNRQRRKAGRYTTHIRGPWTWAFGAGAKIAQISDEGNSLFPEDFWTTQSSCGDGWR